MNLPPVLPAAEPPSRTHETWGGILWRLFFDPGAIFDLLKVPPWRGFLLLFAALITAGLLAGAGTFPGRWQAARDWSAWLGRELGELRLSPKGELAWNRPDTLPAITRHNGWRVDFAPAGRPLAVDRAGGPESRGLWLTPDRAILWEKGSAFFGQTVYRATLLWLGPGREAHAGADTIFGQPVSWDTPAAADSFRLDNVRNNLLALVPEGVTVPGDGFADWTRRHLFAWILAWNCLSTAQDVVVSTIFWLTLFLFIALIVRSPLAAAGFWRAAAFHAFAAVPPVLVAGLYTALDLPFLSYQPVFCLCFLAYWILANRLAEARRRSQDPRPPRRPKPGEDFDDW